MSGFVPEKWMKGTKRKTYTVKETAIKKCREREREIDRGDVV